MKERILTLGGIIRRKGKTCHLPGCLFSIGFSFSFFFFLFLFFSCFFLPFPQFSLLQTQFFLEKVIRHSFFRNVSQKLFFFFDRGFQTQDFRYEVYMTPNEPQLQKSILEILLRRSLLFSAALSFLIIYSPGFTLLFPPSTLCFICISLKYISINFFLLTFLLLQ